MNKIANVLFNKNIILRGFTLLELLVTVVIVGILATFGIAQYSASRENALDKEAGANLRLILAAERIYRMEVRPYSTYQSAADTAGVNQELRLLLPQNDPNWAYSVTTYNVGGASAQFCAQATRTTGTVRWWRIEDPVRAGEPDPEVERAQCAP